MILVFGGAYQGKLDFAKRELGVTEIGDRCIYGLQEWIREIIADGRNINESIEKLISDIKDREKTVGENPTQESGDSQHEIVVIMDDISQGLVPMNVEDRAFREANGRVMIKLAEAATEVYRVFCGLGGKVK